MPSERENALAKEVPTRSEPSRPGPRVESDGREFLRFHPGPPERFRDDRDDILLMGTGCQFRHHPAEVLVDLLGGDDVGKEHPVAEDGGRRVVTGRFDAKDNICHSFRFSAQR